MARVITDCGGIQLTNETQHGPGLVPFAAPRQMGSSTRNPGRRVSEFASRKRVTEFTQTRLVPTRIYSRYLFLSDDFSKRRRGGITFITYQPPCRLQHLGLESISIGSRSNQDETRLDPSVCSHAQLGRIRTRLSVLSKVVRSPSPEHVVCTHQE